MPMLEWEHKMLNSAVEEKKNMVEYVWSSKYGGEVTHTAYSIDLVRMTQTNTSTGTVRRLLHLANDSSQSVTSPFLSNE